MEQRKQLSPTSLSAAFIRQASTLLGCVVSLLVLTNGSWSVAVADARTKERAEPYVQCSVLETQSTGAYVSEEILVLRQGEPIKRTLQGGGSQLFKITLNAGQYSRVAVFKRGIDVTVKLSKGRQHEMDNPSGAHGPVYVSIIAQAADDYILDIRSTESGANEGEYEVILEVLRDATPADTERLAAEEAFYEARRLFREDKKDSYEQAIVEFGKALSYWKNIGDPHWEALTQYCLGVTHRRRGNLKVAEKYFDESLKLQLADYDWRLRASTLNDRGLNYTSLGEPQKALESHNSAYAIFLAHRDRRGQASTFNNIGLIHHRAGALRLALEFYQKALPLRHAENDLYGESNLLLNIGGVYDRLGEPHKALDHYHKALKGFQDLNQRGQLTNHKLLGIGFNNVGVALDKLNEWQKALEYYDQAMKVYQEVGSKPELAALLDNLGELHAVLGDSDKAIDYYIQARNLFTTVKDPEAEASVLIHIGQFYTSQNKLAEALGYFEEALKLKPSSARQANIYTNIGAVYASQSNSRQALEAYENALPLWGEDRRGAAITLHKKGEAYALASEHTKALENFNKALTHWKELADERGEAATLQGIAGTERDRNNLAEALKRNEEALTIIEKLRTRVTSQQLRTLYFAGQQNYYELNIDLNMRLHQRDHSSRYLAAALEASEKSRARSLIDTLVESQTDITEGVGEELLNREREVQQRLNAKALGQMRLLNGKHTKEQATELSKEIADLINEYDNLKAEIRSKSPKYARLTQPQALTLEQIQQLLDNDTLLLEYSLGSERSYLWLVSKSSITSAESLPGRADIENTARRFYELLTAPEPAPNESPADRQRRITDAATQYPSQAAALSKMLLGSVADKLGNKKLLIVGDGVLQYVPFAALPVPRLLRGANVTTKSTASSQGASMPYLIEEHEIISLQSASVLSVLRNEFGNRKRAPFSVAVLADPVFDADDPRLKKCKESGGLPKESATTLTKKSPLAGRDLRLRSGLELAPLPSTRIEAREIRAAVPQDQSMMVALDCDANRATLEKLQNGNYRAVHLATHGVLNTEHPELSGVVLSLVGPDGKQRDGILRLHDIYKLKLPVEMVVLSACSTGLGSLIKGEGLVGLTRGFMYAGSPRVVATLWRVDDYPTAFMMGRFYHHIAKEGSSPAAALRQTQIEMLKGRRWPLPYFWAAFILQGEWKEIR